MPVNASWQHVTIPLAAFGDTDGTLIRGFRLRDNTITQLKGDVFFDNIKFVKLPDFDPPTLESASFATSLEILVTFGERVTSTDAVTTTNYKIKSETDVNYQTAQTPDIAALQTRSKQVLLTVPYTLKTNVSYTVTVSEVRDLVGNTITMDSSTAFTVPYLAIVSALPITLEEVRVFFEEAVNEGDATTVGNFAVSSKTDPRTTRPAGHPLARSVSPRG